MHTKGFVQSIYGETIFQDVNYITEILKDKMTQFWNAIEDGNPINSKKDAYMKIKETERYIKFDDEEESDEDVIDL